jgi:hypothetical protein
MITGGDDTSGDAGPGGPGPNEFIDAPICDQTTPIPVTTVSKTPDVMLVVDKSGSMGDPLQTGGQKWSVMRNALNQVVSAKQDEINFGLLLFPADDQCGVNPVQVGIAGMNATMITNQLAPVSPVGATPTYMALGMAQNYYATFPVNPDGRYVLLATDGLPNCAGNGANPNGATVSESIDAIEALAAAGIKTFVIGFGDINADPTTLQAMAVAGMTDNYYPANSPADLQAALDAISGTVTSASCSFALDTVPPDPSKLSVTLDGAVIPRDPSHATGWDYDPATNTITFYGSTCDEIASGTGSVVGVDYGCGGPIIE